MAPNDVLSQVHPVGQDIGAEIERLGEYALGARRYHDAVDSLAFDVGLDQFDTFSAAKDVVRPANRSVHLAGGEVGQFIDIERVSYFTAFTDIDANLVFHGAIA
jgi:hypothetical protein